jgi:hypothetical protein
MQESDILHACTRRIAERMILPVLSPRSSNAAAACGKYLIISQIYLLLAFSFLLLGNYINNCIVYVLATELQSTDEELFHASNMSLANCVGIPHR